MSAPRVEFEGVGVSYADASAVAGVDLVCEAGEITALIGPSGCGKSSLLKTVDRMTDLIEGCRVHGRVRVGGLDVHAGEVDVVALRRRVGMIFQEPAPFPLSIVRNLELPLQEHGIGPRAERRARARRALEDVGLWSEVEGRLSAPATGLSGGQQQRLCLARALALEPEVLLLDEPCSALDPLSSGVVEDLVCALRGRYTIVIVTHDLAQARRMADRVAFFWSANGVGRLVEAGPCAQVFEAPREELTAAYVSGRRA